MDKKLKIAIPVIAGTLAIGGSAGAAFARNADQAAIAPAAAYDTATTGAEAEAHPYYCGGYGGMMGHGAGIGVTPQVADLLGTTTAELRDRLASGDTLADIAAEQGISLDQLIDTVTAPFNEHIDLMLKYGYLSQEDAATLRQQVREQAQVTITSQNGEAGGWHEFMEEMMDDYGHGMMWGWGATDGDLTPDTNANRGPGPGNGGMMDGGGYGGMMGDGSFGGGFGGMMR